MNMYTARRARRVMVAALAAALAVTAGVAVNSDAQASGRPTPKTLTYDGQPIQTLPTLPINRCYDPSLPKAGGTNAPLPADPHGYGYANETAIGWEGNYYAPLAYLSGSYFARGVPTHYTAGGTTYCGAMYAFGVYNYGLTGSQGPAAQSVHWSEVGGYLPAMRTSFVRNKIAITITDFADRQKVGGVATELVYTRITIHNTTRSAVSVPPQASGPNLVTLASARNSVAAGATAVDDYVAAVDTFGVTYSLPHVAQVARSATSYDTALKHMTAYWNGRLATTPTLALPNIELAGTELRSPGTAISNAYKAAYIYTRIVQTGKAQFSGANNYDSLLNHDVPSIIDNRFSTGDFVDARNLLLTARISENPNFDEQGANWYWDGPWKTPSVWADYLRDTNDLAFVRAFFHDDAKQSSPWGPSLYTLMHTYYLAQLDTATGYLQRSNDNDSEGVWLFDDESALAGLSAYRYIASRIGNTTEATWAANAYASLLASTNAALSANQQTNGFDYLPCEVATPNSADRCATANDANWAGSNLWSQNVWDIFLQGGSLSGVLGDPTQTDNLYSMGYARLANEDIPFPSFGAYPGYSVALNTAYANASLYGNQYRSLPFTSYAWQIQHTTGGPNSWWEANSAAPDPKNPWVGSHAMPQFGASPYAWPMAGQTQTIQQALVAEGLVATANGGFGDVLYVGRGVPDQWLVSGAKVGIGNLTGTYDVATGKRSTYGVSFTTSTVKAARTVTIGFTGTQPTKDVRIQLPVFGEAGVRSVSGGTYRASTGTVTVTPGTRTVRVTLGRSARPTVTSSITVNGSSTSSLTDGQPATATVTVHNTGTGAIKATVTQHVPTGWSATPASRDLSTIDAGDSATATFTVTAPPTGTSTADVAFDAAWSGSAGASGTVRTSQSVSSQPELPVRPGSTNLAPAGTPSASYTSPWEHVSAINDGIYPSGPNDQNHYRWGTYPESGTQWVELDWSSPITTNASALYFLDDGGGVLMPSTWAVQYWDGSAWQNVANASGYGLDVGSFNQVTYDSVTTTKLRVQMQGNNAPVGIEQWVVDS